MNLQNQWCIEWTLKIKFKKFSRVHITEATLNALGGAFEVVPGLGEER